MSDDRVRELEEVGVLRDRSSRPATHEARLVGSIALAGPDGERRVPFSMVNEPDGTLIVFSYLPDESSCLERFDRSGRYLGRIARLVAGHEPGCVTTPAGVASDGRGAFLVPDAERSVIVELDAQGRLVGEHGAPGTAPGQLHAPRDVDVLVDGSLVVADTGNDRIQLWDRRAGVIACWGRASDDEDEDEQLSGGTAPGEFRRPLGVTGDAAGRVWVADTNNHRVQRLVRGRDSDLVFARRGQAAGELMFPMDVRIDDQGAVVIVDMGGRRMQWFTPDGALERAILPADIVPESASLADIDVDERGVIYLPIGPESRLVLIEPGARLP